jgi:cold shock CspA family protein
MDSSGEVVFVRLSAVQKAGLAELRKGQFLKSSTTNANLPRRI